MALGKLIHLYECNPLVFFRIIKIQFMNTSPTKIESYYFDGVNVI